MTSPRTLKLHVFMFNVVAYRCGINDFFLIHLNVSSSIQYLFFDKRMRLHPGPASCLFLWLAPGGLPAFSLSLVVWLPYYD